MIVAERPSKSKRWGVWILAAAILLPAGLGFFIKLVEFVRALKSEDGVDFTIIPVANYFLVSAGFVCLMGWAVVHGMFRNVEAPKYKMLEQEETLDRLEGREWSE